MTRVDLLLARFPKKWRPYLGELVAVQRETEEHAGRLAAELECLWRAWNAREQMEAHDRELYEAGTGHQECRVQVGPGHYACPFHTRYRDARAALEEREL